MAFNYNISDLMQKAFGITGSIPLGQQYIGYASFSPKLGGYKVPQIDLNEQTATSYLGTPILMPVTFDEVKWTEIVNGEKKDMELPQITMPPATLVDFSQSKIIEKTRIAGRKGTVKEFIGMDDWSIRLRGIIINEKKDDLPEDEIKLLKQLKNCPVAIRILNPMCLWLDIYNVVVEDVTFPALEGFPNAQPFTIELSSDEVFELKYKNNL